MVKIILGFAKWRKGFVYLPIDMGMQYHQVFVLCPTFRHRELAIWSFLVKGAYAVTVINPYQAISESFLMSKGGDSS
jgi:hypothetical protein